MDDDITIKKVEDLFIIVSADPLIKSRILEVLYLNPFIRRNLLNNWLEQLRMLNAQPELIKAITCLFDDAAVKKILQLINLEQ